MALVIIAFFAGGFIGMLVMALAVMADSDEGPL